MRMDEPHGMKMKKIKTPNLTVEGWAAKHGCEKRTPQHTTTHWDVDDQQKSTTKKYKNFQRVNLSIMWCNTNQPRAKHMRNNWGKEYQQHRPIKFTEYIK